jgi:hypothetical protein
MTTRILAMPCKGLWGFCQCPRAPLRAQLCSTCTKDPRALGSALSHTFKFPSIPRRQPSNLTTFCKAQLKSNPSHLDRRPSELHEASQSLWVHDPHRPWDFTRDKGPGETLGTWRVLRGHQRNPEIRMPCSTFAHIGSVPVVFAVRSRRH